MSAPAYTDKDLYGASGQPQAADINQGGYGDCYYLASFGALAVRQPQTIRDAIHYDAAEQSFSVRLYKEGAHRQAEPITVKVTQADLRGEQVKGVDSPRYWRGPGPAPLWPEVMESAYAKLEAERANEPIAAELDHIGHGGYPRSAIYTLTGQRDTTVPASQLGDMDQAYARLSAAVREDRPMVLSTNAMREVPHDGLVKGDSRTNPPSGHAYMVENVYKDAQGEVMLAVRNPWGTNRDPTQGVNSDDPVANVKLKDILDNGHLQSIDIGPAAPVRQHEQVKQPGHAQAAPGKESPTGDPYLDRMYAALNDPAAMKQAMADLANSPHGQAFRADGHAQYAELQNQQLQQQLAEQQRMQMQQPVQQGPALSR